MRKPSVFKGGFILLLAVALAMPLSAATTHPSMQVPQPTGSSRDIMFEDGFENYTDFVTEFPPWTNIDVDGNPTYGHPYYDWPNETLPQAFIIFNPNATTPPMTGLPDALPHTGDKYAACFNDNNAQNNNDDWLITPQLFGVFDNITFWAKTFSNQYELERFQIGVSTTTTNPSAFKIITPDPYVLVPTAWSKFTFDLGSHYGAYYIGIHDVSHNSWFLMIDDLQIHGQLGADTIPPVTTCQLNGTMQGDVYTSHVTVTLKATDEKSGVNVTKYTLDGGSQKKYLGSFTLFTEGTHTITYYSIDNAGNIETTKNATFTIHFPIAITIKGGFGITVTIDNTGTTTLVVPWRLELTGFILSGSPKSGTATIAAGGHATIKDTILGFGKTMITASTDDITKTTNGRMWLFFVFGLS